MIFIDTELVLQFFFAKHKESRITIMKNKRGKQISQVFYSCLYIRLYILGVSISFTLCFSTCTDEQIHIFIIKKRVHSPILITMLALSKVFSNVPKRTFGSSGIILK